jgi:hypothetical protein
MTILSWVVAAVIAITVLPSVAFRHRVMQLRLIDGVIQPTGWANEPDSWGVGYGRIIKGRPVNFFGAPVGITIRSDDLRPIKAEEYPAAANKK